MRQLANNVTFKAAAAKPINCNLCSLAVLVPIKCERVKESTTAGLPMD